MITGAWYLNDEFVDRPPGEFLFLSFMQDVGDASSSQY